MTNIGQVTFIGSDIFIKCDSNWTCCQREQAKAKVENTNAAIQASPSKSLKVLKKVSKAQKRAKKNCQARETGRLMKEMNADPKKGANDNATSPCLAEQMEDDWKKGKKSTSKMGVQMDHPVETKVGGPADTTLKALDDEINNFFGNAFAKNTGDKMRKANKEIKSVSLDCAPPCKPPKKSDKNKNYSTPAGAKYPASPAPGSVSPKRAA